MGGRPPSTVSPDHCCSDRCIAGWLLEDCLHRFRHCSIHTRLAPVELCLVEGANVALGSLLNFAGSNGGFCQQDSRLSEHGGKGQWERCLACSRPRCHFLD